MNVHGVHEFECKKDEDKCLIWQNQQRFLKIKTKQHFKDERKQLKRKWFVLHK